MQANSVQINVSVWHRECRSILLMFTEIFRNKIFEYKGRGHTYLLKGLLNTLLLFALLWEMQLFSFRRFPCQNSFYMQTGCWQKFSNDLNRRSKGHSTDCFGRISVRKTSDRLKFSVWEMSSRAFLIKIN